MDEHDVYPVKLGKARTAYLRLPRDFSDDDVNQVVKWVRLIAKHNADDAATAVTETEPPKIRGK